MPVIFVAGNHEYYGQVYVDALDAIKANRGDYPGVYFLENSQAVLAGVRFPRRDDVDELQSLQ
ncbi:hypothetical protein ACOJBO_25700 [Rhizobium beringeri]